MADPAGPVTRDRFLGGRLTLAQPKDGYRAGIDPVLLAAAAPAQAGQSVLDLGCGVGTAALCLGARVAGTDLWGVERQPGYAALARENATANSLPLTVVEGDIAHMPAALRSRSFDHVIANPPFFDRSRGSAAPEAGREAGRGEALPLAVWIDAAARRLAPGGRLTLIQQTQRLPDLLGALDARLGSAALLPVVPREGRDATLVILHARKGGRGAFRLLAPFVLHEGARHLRDGDDYTDAARRVLRGADRLPVEWP